VLNDQNKQLSEQYRFAEHELTNLRQKNNDLTADLARKSRELEAFRVWISWSFFAILPKFQDQCELDKRTELNNQANNHRLALASTKETLHKALEKLRADFDQQERVLRKCNDENVHLKKELKAAPVKYRAQAIQELQRMPLAEGKFLISFIYNLLFSQSSTHSNFRTALQTKGKSSETNAASAWRQQQWKHQHVNFISV
jgi:chromosome segregation ATPase